MAGVGILNTGNEHSRIIVENSPQIPGYTIHEQIGRGGMAYVYRALQHNFDAEVAVKVLDPRLTADPQFGERFIREARIMRSLKHPHVAAVYDVGQHGNIYYLSMEYLPGGSLKELVDQAGHPGEVLPVLAKVAEALDYAHSMDFVHRDIKPENILMRGPGDPVISDFGIARVLNSEGDHTKTGTVMGSPHYMSPEQALGQPVDHRSDIYSFGVLCYFAVCADVPYSEGSAVTIGIRHVRDPVPTLPAQYAPMQSFVNRALAKRPADRFHSCTDLVDDFVKHLALVESQGMGLHSGSDTIVAAARPAVPVASSPDPGTAPQRSDVVAASRPQSQRKNLYRMAVLGLLLLTLGAVSAGVYLLWERKAGVPEVAFNLETQRQLLRAGEFLESGDVARALDEFLAVVAKEPDNQAAQKGMVHIAGIFQREASTALANNDLDAAAVSVAALQRIDTGLPGVEEVIVAYAEKVAALEREQRTQEASSAMIASLLQEAALAEQQQQLISPPGENAFEKYSQVATLDPGNTDAASGLRRLGDHYLQLAKDHQLAGDNISAKANFNIARKMSPELTEQDMEFDAPIQPTEEQFESAK